MPTRVSLTVTHAVRLSWRSGLFIMQVMPGQVAVPVAPLPSRKDPMPPLRWCAFSTSPFRSPPSFKRGNEHQPKKSPSHSVGARVVRSGGVGLYGRPICIKLRKEEVKRRKGEPASGDRIEREKILDLSPKGASYGQASTFKRIGAAIFSRATQRTGEPKRLCPAHDGAVRRPKVCANVCVGLDE